MIRYDYYCMFCGHPTQVPPDEQLPPLSGKCTEDDHLVTDFDADDEVQE